MSHLTPRYRTLEKFIGENHIHVVGYTVLLLLLERTNPFIRRLTLYIPLSWTRKPTWTDLT